MTAERYEQQPYANPEGATEVLLVRHGASQAYVPGEEFELHEGTGDPPLAEAGHAQARAVADRLADTPLAAIYTSTLQRTHQTAAPLAGRLGLEPRPLADLREVNLGEWEGGEFRVRAHAHDPVFLQLLTEERWDVVPGAERHEDFSARVRRGFDQVATETGPGTVAAFVHGGVITELCAQATGSRPFAFLLVDNGSITRIVRWPDGRLVLRGFNDTTHVP